MKNSASYNDFKKLLNETPRPPKAARAVTYSNDKGEDGNFLIININIDTISLSYFSPPASVRSLSYSSSEGTTISTEFFLEEAAVHAELSLPNPSPESVAISTSPSTAPSEYDKYAQYYRWLSRLHEENNLKDVWEEHYS